VAALLFVLVAGALAVAACGGGETTSSPSPTATSPGPAMSSSPPATGPRAAVFYREPPLPPPKAITTGTVGWTFTPTVDIGVTDLGCYDAYQDGLATRHRVGVWDADGADLLASVTVGPGSTLDGAFRWESLETPLVLEAGRPYLVGTEEQPVKVNDQETFETVYYEDVYREQWAPEIFDRGMRTTLGLSGGRFMAPTNATIVADTILYGWMSPNFKFVPMSTASPTP